MADASGAGNSGKIGLGAGDSMVGNSAEIGLGEGDFTGNSGKLGFESDPAGSCDMRSFQFPIFTESGEGLGPAAELGVRTDGKRIDLGGSGTGESVDGVEIGGCTGESGNRIQYTAEEVGGQVAIRTDEQQGKGIRVGTGEQAIVDAEQPGKVIEAADRTEKRMMVKVRYRTDEQGSRTHLLVPDQFEVPGKSRTHLPVPEKGKGSEESKGSRGEAEDQEQSKGSGTADLNMELNKLLNMGSRAEDLTMGSGAELLNKGSGSGAVVLNKGMNKGRESGAEDLKKERKAEDQNTERSRSQLFYFLSLLTSNKREEKRLRHITYRTLLLLIVSPIVLWFSHDELVVWRLAFLLCYGCFFWTNFLAQTLKRGMVFGYITYGLLLASWADGMLNPGTGVFIVHLDSHFATGLVGFALAERLESQGVDKSALEVSIPTSEEEERLSVLRFFGGLALAGPMLGVIGGILWLVCHSADYAADLLVLDTLVVLPPALVFGIIIVAVYQLRGATISPDRISFVVLYFVFVTFLRAVCKVLLGNVVAMIITWVAVMFLSGLLGYCVGVVASSKCIVRNAYWGGDDQGKHKLA